MTSYINSAVRLQKAASLKGILDARGLSLSMDECLKIIDKLDRQYFPFQSHNPFDGGTWQCNN